MSCLYTTNLHRQIYFGGNVITACITFTGNMLVQYRKCDVRMFCMDGWAFTTQDFDNIDRSFHPMFQVWAIPKHFSNLRLVSAAFGGNVHQTKYASTNQLCFKV